MAADEVDRDFPKQRTVRHHSLGKMRNRNAVVWSRSPSLGAHEIAGALRAWPRLIASWFRSKPLQLRRGSHKVADETCYRCRMLDVRRMTGSLNDMDLGTGEAI